VIYISNLIKKEYKRMNWFIDCITKNYANFNGRARRKEFWMFVLFGSILLTVTYILDTIIGSNFILTTILLLVLFIPNLAVTVRRLHDTDKSGWLYLLSLIPLVSLVLIVFACQDSTPGSNQYGDNPKGINL
jgi:uncharacterized membrane protein YhaH (DUF805 family)